MAASSHKDADVVALDALDAGHVHAEVQDAFAIVEHRVPPVDIVSFHIANLGRWGILCLVDG